MIIGDITLTVVDPEALKELIKAANRYDDATRVYGLKCKSLDTLERNQSAGAMYESRKAFRNCLATISGGLEP